MRIHKLTGAGLESVFKDLARLRIEVFRDFPYLYDGTLAVGDAPWLAGLETNVGAAAVFAPPDMRFSAEGTMARGTLNAAQWLYADLDLQALARIREDGEVLNARNWALQPGAAALPRARTVKLE